MKIAALIAFVLAAAATAAEPVLDLPGGDGPGKATRVVLLAGDEEYRSEEALPMLAQILSVRHGFPCTVLFSIDPATGVIDPTRADSLAGSEALDRADVLVMSLRFRRWPDEVMRRFEAALHRGVPIVALRTSTHAFQFKDGAWTRYNRFGKDVLGEGWVDHWGRHRLEATRGVAEPGAQEAAVLRGVGDLFVETDVYEAHPPADATILMRGQVLQGMEPGSPPAAYRRKRASDRVEQGINNPMMPVAWTRSLVNDAGTTNRIFCTTMGAASDLDNEGLRRLVVNAVYEAAGLPVPARADVEPVGAFHPSFYGFGDYRKGVRPADLARPAAP